MEEKKNNTIGSGEITHDPMSSPYNFVPIGRKVYYPSWGNIKVPYDIPMVNGKDGVIEVSMTNISPLFIYAGGRLNEPYSEHIELSSGEWRYFLPGSSIRGMLRTIVEAISFSEMQQFSNEFIPYLDFKDIDGNDTDFIKEARKSKPGWLVMERGEWKLFACKGDSLRISIDEVKEFIGDKDNNTFDEKVYSWERNEYVSSKKGEMYPVVERGGVKYRLVCTGIKKVGMNVNKEDLKSMPWLLKKREYLFPDEIDNKPLKVKKMLATKKDNSEIPEEGSMKDFIQVFRKLHSKERYIKKYLDRMYKGMRVAVFYQQDDKGLVIAASMSKINKLPRQYTTKDLIEKRVCKKKMKYDLAKLLFGYSGSDRNYRIRGKVQIGNAFCTKTDVPPEPDEEVTLMLRAPRATYHPFYIRQDENYGKYKTYDDNDAQLAGRKFYRIHGGDSVLKTEIPHIDDKDEQDKNNAVSKFRPVSPGHTFICRLYLHNVCPVEMGALLAAITLWKDKDAYHNIGSAKNMGYGKLCVNYVKMDIIDDNRDIDFYLREFEKELSVFTMLHPDLYVENADEPMYWSETPTLMKLLAIKHEHNDADVKVMNRMDYRYWRREGEFGILSEPEVKPCSFLTDDDKEKIRIRVQEIKDMLSSTPKSM